jgi:hypothetical protein
MGLARINAGDIYRSIQLPFKQAIRIKVGTPSLRPRIRIEAVDESISLVLARK